MPLYDKIVTLAHRIAVNDNNPETVDTFIDALELYEKYHGEPHALDASLPEIQTQ